MEEQKKDYDIALSFAGEDRPYVEMVAENLKERGVRFFYDKYANCDLWGKNLYDHFSEIYRLKAKFILMFCSKFYAEKIWPNHERRAAQARAIEASSEYILPARFDDTNIPGLLPTVAYIDLRKMSPIEVSLLVCQKLGIDTLAIKSNRVPPPKSPSVNGTVEFDYSNHDGRFVIGEGLHAFETCWHKASNKAIHCTNDGKGIRGIAIADNVTDLIELNDVSKFDFTSRCRTARVGDFVIYQNIHGLFAVLRVIGINCRLRDDSADRLIFDYWILNDGSADFSFQKQLP